MTIKASGIAAFVFVAGLWICATGPSQAADDADSAATPVVKQSSHLKTDAHRKSNPQAERSPSGRKTAAAADSDSPAFQSSQLPPSVANANAQLMTDTAASKDARAMTARANNIVQTAADNTSAAQPAQEAPVVASDQLNDVDRALAPPIAQQADAAAPVDAQQAPPAKPPVVVAGSAGNSTWDQTSLIGKIFIGFGTLLTLASAARMFIA
jgi:hypothetical protein